MYLAVHELVLCSDLFAYAFHSILLFLVVGCSTADSCLDVVLFDDHYVLVPMASDVVALEGVTDYSVVWLAAETFPLHMGVLAALLVEWYPDWVVVFDAKWRALVVLSFGDYGALGLLDGGCV